MKCLVVKTSELARFLLWVHNHRYPPPPHTHTHTHTHTPAIDDDNLITESPASGGQFGFFVHPGETISIPFKYQSFRQPSLPAAEKGDGYGEEEEGSRTVKVGIELDVESFM